MGHLNGFLKVGDGNLIAKNRKIQMPGGLPEGGMLRLQIDRCIGGESKEVDCSQGNFLPL